MYKETKICSKVASIAKSMAMLETSCEEFYFGGRSVVDKEHYNSKFKLMSSCGELKDGLVGDNIKQWNLELRRKHSVEDCNYVK